MWRPGTAIDKVAVILAADAEKRQRCPGFFRISPWDREMVAAEADFVRDCTAEA